MAGLAFFALLGTVVSSAAEAALFHLPRQGLSPLLRNRLRKLLAQPFQISDVLRTLDFLSDMVCLGCLGVLFGDFTQGTQGVAVFLILVGVPLLFLVAEVLPRSLGSRFPVLILGLTLIPFEVVYRLLLPLCWGARRAVEVFLIPFEKRWGERDLPDEEELRAVLGYSARRGDLGQEGVDMVEGILDLDETRLAGVLTPRTKIVSLDADATWEEALECFAQTPYRRLPLKAEDSEDFPGVLYAKDMLSAWFQDQRPSPKQLAREPFFLPGVAYLDDALARLREQGNQMAVVVDEYGGVEGLVTMEDILEEVVGDIRDEHDGRENRPEAVSVRRQGESFDLDGALPLEEAADLLDLDPEEVPVETLGGLVFHYFGYLPEEGEEVRQGSWVFKVLRRDRFRLERILVRRAVSK